MAWCPNGRWPEFETNGPCGSREARSSRPGRVKYWSENNTAVPITFSIGLFQNVWCPGLAVSLINGVFCPAGTSIRFQMIKNRDDSQPFGPWNHVSCLNRTLI